MVCAVGVYAQTTKWRDIYKVKKKDTILASPTNTVSPCPS